MPLAPLFRQGSNQMDPETIIEKAQIMPRQQKMLNAFEDGDYERLLDTLYDTEKATALNSEASRILGRSNWDEDALFLLAQLHHEVLRSLLSNTFPQRAAQQADLRHELRAPNEVQKGHDPVIYVNFCVGNDGKGVPIAAFDRFLTSLEFAVKIKNDSSAYAELQIATVREEVEATYRSRIPGSRVGFFAGIRDKMPGLAEEVRNFVKCQRRFVLPQAQKQQASHVAIHGEVGLAAKGYERCKQHANLEPNSPPLFKLVQLVLGALHPERRFGLRQVILFHAVKASQVEIGESIGSIICSSYITSGGVNVAQAGVNIGMEIPRMGAQDWKQVTKAAFDRRHLVHVTPNFQRFLTSLKEEEEQQKAETDEAWASLKRWTDYKKTCDDNKRRRASLQVSAVDGPETRLREVTVRIDEAVKLIADEEQSGQSQQKNLEAFNVFLNALEAVHPK